MIFFFTFIPQQKQGTVELNPTHNTLDKRPSIEGSSLIGKLKHTSVSGAMCPFIKHSK